MDGPRVRFAPSPTGFFHVGSARTALFNWLFARRHAGTMLLRIEDTDEERNREEWVDGIVEAMTWLGFAPDEPPVRQSEFADAHRAASDRLLEAGFLYGCDCTREQIDERLHVFTWHLLPALALIALSTLAGGTWLRFRRRTRRPDPAD